MLTPEELVRRCSYAVACVTGVDPFERRHEVKGDDDLQIARKLWVYSISQVFGIPTSEASRLLARNRETIIINLAEIEAWRDPSLHPRAGRMLDDALSTLGDALRPLMESGQIAAIAFPTPIERSRMRRTNSKAARS